MSARYVANIPLHYIGNIQRFLESEGVSTQQWLGSASLTIDDVIEERKLISYPEYEKLVLQAIALSKRPNMGLLVGQALSINTHGTMGFALLSCQNVRQVFQVIQRYVVTRTPLISLEITEHEQSVTILLSETQDLSAIRACFFEVVMVTVSNVLATVLPNQTLSWSVKLNFPKPPYVAQYAELIHCPVSFSCDSVELIFSRETFDLPLQHADANAFHHAQSLCEQELKKWQFPATMADRVELILKDSKHQFLTLYQVSCLLHMSTRTLNRKLKQEDTSYQLILDQVRSNLAKQYLLIPGAKVANVAFSLGYSDVANFRRAFKRWYQLSPQQFIILNNTKEQT